MMPFSDAVRQLLDYDPATGLIVWKAKRKSRGGYVMPGDVAGTPNGQGYVQIKVLGRVWRAHRLAWLLQTGETPPAGYEVDHINGERSDNRWLNLRLVTRSQNNMNQGVKRNNKSGCKGVSFRKDTQKWHARITVAGTIKLLGNYGTREEAVEARRAAERVEFGEHASINPTRIAVERYSAPLAA